MTTYTDEPVMDYDETLFLALRRVAQMAGAWSKDDRAPKLPVDLVQLPARRCQWLANLIEKSS